MAVDLQLADQYDVYKGQDPFAAPKFDTTGAAAQTATPAAGSSDKAPLWKAGLIALSEILKTAGSGGKAAPLAPAGAHGNQRSSTSPYGGAPIGPGGTRPLTNLGQLLSGR